MTKAKKTGFLGPRATYTEQAAQALTGATAKNAEASTPYPSIAALFAAVASGELDRAVVPLENMLQGPVTETFDNLYAFADQVLLTHTLVLPIQHALGVLPAVASDDMGKVAGAIQTVLSKDQALKQCGRFLDQHLEHAERRATGSTAAAMKHVAHTGDPTLAAIGSEAALSHYGLQPVATSIGDRSDNKTRFGVVTRRDEGVPTPTGADATALVIYPHRDRVGLLRDILAICSTQHGLSLSSIHSRPDKRGAFRFYIEIEGHPQSSTVGKCIASLQRNLGGDGDIEIKVVGIYPRSRFANASLRTIGIIGGTGKMGRWFEALFRRAGVKVLIAGRHTPLTPEACVKESDAVLINVPIHATTETIAKLAPIMRPGQLLVDNTSVKTAPVAAMLKHAPAGVEVVGMHTVFGPTIPTLRGENVIFTRTERCGPLTEELESLFYKYGARITHTDPEHHDLQMAFHQNLEHFGKVALAQVLCERFEQPEALAAYSSPNSRRSLATMARILRGDPELYAEIQSHNPAGLAMLKDFVRVAQNLVKAVEHGDAAAFASNMAGSANTLGDDYLAELMQGTTDNGVDPS